MAKSRLLAFVVACATLMLTGGLLHAERGGPTMVAMTLAACSLLCVSARAAVSATQRKLVVTGWATYTALIALAALLSSFAEARPLDALPLAIAGLSGAIATRWTLRQCHRRRKSIFENYLSQ